MKSLSRQLKKRPITKIIIDNILTNVHWDEIRAELQSYFPEEIEKITILKREGVLISPKNTKSFNTIMKNKHVLTRKKIRPTTLHTHSGRQDLRPLLCINQVAYNKENELETLDLIEEEITRNKNKWNTIKIEGLHRHQTGTEYISTLIKFKVEDKINHNELINTDIKIGNKTHKIRLFIDKSANQCRNC